MAGGDDDEQGLGKDKRGKEFPQNATKPRLDRRLAAQVPRNKKVPLKEQQKGRVCRW